MPYKDKTKEAAYREAHKEEKRAYNRAYREAHVEKLRAYDRARNNGSRLEARRSRYQKDYREHAALILQKNKAYYESHKAERLAYKKAWVAAHADHVRAQRRTRRESLRSSCPSQPQAYESWVSASLGSMRRRTKKCPHYTIRGITCTISPLEFRAWCNSQKPVIEYMLGLKTKDRMSGPSIDRINPNGDYSLDNIRITTVRANVGKTRSWPSLCDELFAENNTEAGHSAVQPPS